MSISAYIAIYAAIVATVVLIWTIWQNRKYLKFDEIIAGDGNDVGVELYLTNKTKRTINIRQVCFLDEDGSLYAFTCKVSSYWKNEPIMIGDDALRTVLMEDNAKYLFMIDVKQIKQGYDETSRYLFSYIAVVDDSGRTYKHRMPQDIRNLFRE